MTKLFDNLKLRVLSEGSLTLADFMGEALGNSEHGYYKNESPIGESGDFITSPEISQMFGELIGLWSAVCWKQLGCPQKFNFIELGPGRGTLLVDAIRAARGVPGYLDALEFHLVETSPILTQCQKQSLLQIKNNLVWHEHFDHVPGGPFFLIGNEFLDALPIRQYLGAAGEWYERIITLNDDCSAFCWSTSPIPASINFPIPTDFVGCNDGVIWEICSEARKIVSSISSALQKWGGVAAFIDYGYDKQLGGDTFQAVRHHKYVNPLMAPGLADLTAHVDFEALKLLAEEKGIKVSGPITQRVFLSRLGIRQRSERLMNGVTQHQKSVIKTGLKRLIDDNKMGSLFKVIALSYPKTFKPEGFSDD